MKKRRVLIWTGILTIPLLFLYCDHDLKKMWSDPEKIGRYFCSSHIEQDKEGMYRFANDTTLRAKIDSAIVVPLVENIDVPYDELSDFIRLETFKRLGQRIVAVYSYDYLAGKEENLFYAVSLQKGFTKSYWIKLREFLYGLPLVGSAFGESPRPMTKYKVVDFYGEIVGDAPGRDIFSFSEKERQEFMDEMKRLGEFWKSEAWRITEYEYLSSWSRATLISEFISTKSRFDSLAILEMTKEKEFLGSGR